MRRSTSGQAPRPVLYACSVYTPRRWIMIVLGCVGIAIGYADRVNIALASIIMKEEFRWSYGDMALINSSFYLGYAISNLLGGCASDKFGGHRVFGLGVLWCSIFTFLTPIAAYASFQKLVWIRFCLGLGEGAVFPAMHSLTARWIPDTEKGFAIAFFSNGVMAGIVCASAISPSILFATDWPALFQIAGCISIVWVLMWALLVRDSPEEHQSLCPPLRISPYEVAHLRREITLPPKRPTRIPWRLLLCSRQMLVSLQSCFALGRSMFVTLSWLPDYLLETYNISFQALGWTALLPYLFSLPAMPLAGWIADRAVHRHHVSPANVRLVYHWLCTVGPAICFLFLAYGPVPNIAVALVYLTFSRVFGVFAVFTVSQYHFELCPRFAGVFFSVGNACSTLGGLVGVELSGIFLDRAGSWDSVFLVMCGLLGSAALLWTVGARGMIAGACEYVLNIACWCCCYLREEERLSGRMGC